VPSGPPIQLIIGWLAHFVDALLETVRQKISLPSSGNQFLTFFGPLGGEFVTSIPDVDQLAGEACAPYSARVNIRLRARRSPAWVANHGGAAPRCQYDNAFSVVLDGTAAAGRMLLIKS
jgi:hypothetical protein